MMEGFQVDVILHSLRELQKAKSQNERVLAGEYAKRKQIEAQLESTNSKLITTTEKHNKMKEMLQVAELKVAQTQAQAKMFEQLNCERRDKITELNSQIAQRNEERKNCMDRYENQITALTEKFRTAWHTQSDEAIHERQTQQQQEIEDYKIKISANKEESDGLSNELAEVTIDYNQPTALELLGGVTEEVWTATIALFDAEHKASMVSLRSKQDKDEQSIEQLTMERTELAKILEDMQKPEQNNEE